MIHPLLERPKLIATWLGLGALVGVLCGLGGALFLAALGAATDWREHNLSIVYALPLAGLVIGWLYERYGAPIAGGSNLVIQTARDGGPTIPLRMAPMVVIGTVLTHLFGGSAGREGTAVQMGASLADATCYLLKLNETLRQHVVVAGFAGGFGAVFGTPVAATIFALEVVRPGRARYDSLILAITAACVGDMVCHALPIHHAKYAHPEALALSPMVALKWIVFAASLALLTLAFIHLTSFIKRQLTHYLPRLPLRMMVGGALVVVLWQLSGTSDLLGLGVPTIQRALIDPTLPAWYFAGKLLLTSITLGAGYLGGEVTPLFFIGASWGNVFAQLVDLPLAMTAALGLAAIFAASSNAPIALCVMLVELCGAHVLPHAALVLSLTYVMTGPRTIYSAQALDDKPGVSPS
jgi:H+/Cl- antiporter ClcA